MKLYSKILLLVLIGLLSCTEDMLDPAPVDTFVKFYGDQYRMEAIDAVVHPDGGIILLAASEAETEANPPTTYYFTTVIKVNKYGTKEWQISAQPQGYVRPSAIHISGNDEYLIIGENRIQQTPGVFNSYLSLQKATSAGFSQIYTTQSIDLNVRGKAVTKLSNGNIVTVGEVASGSIVKSILMEFTSDLNLVWKKTFDDEKISINNRIFENSEGRVYWAGTVQRENINKAELLGATPGNLSEISIDFPQINGSEGSIANNAFDFTSNGFLFLGDYVDGDRTKMRLIRTSLAGTNDNIRISSVFNLNSKSVCLSPTGGILALGEATDSKLGDFYLSEIGADGVEKFNKVYGGTNRDVPAKVLRVNNGIVMFGHTNFADANTLVLIKTDVNGEF